MGRLTEKNNKKSNNNCGWGKTQNDIEIRVQYKNSVRKDGLVNV